MKLRRLGVICLLSASVIAMTSGRADATSFTYTFDSNAQGWAGNGAGGPTPVTWNSSGGNPGGDVSVSVSGGISGTGTISTFQGLFRSLSLDLASYGGTLSVDTALLASSNLLSANGVNFQLIGVVNGNPFIVAYSSGVNLLGGGWNSTSVRLDTSTAWTFTNIFSADTHAMTQADWNTYLPLINAMLITDNLSFLRSTGGSGTFAFDNVNLTEAATPPSVPEPTSMFLLATGLAGLRLRRRSIAR